MGRPRLLLPAPLFCMEARERVSFHHWLSREEESCRDVIGHVSVCERESSRCFRVHSDPVLAAAAGRQGLVIASLAMQE